eukprot:jgi/Bigna1/75376/fgenesh1_pg.34_\
MEQLHMVVDRIRVSESQGKIWCRNALRRHLPRPEFVDESSPSSSRWIHYCCHYHYSNYRRETKLEGDSMAEDILTQTFENLGVHLAGTDGLPGTDTFDSDIEEKNPGRGREGLRAGHNREYSVASPPEPVLSHIGDQDEDAKNKESSDNDDGPPPPIPASPSKLKAELERKQMKRRDQSSLLLSMESAAYESEANPHLQQQHLCPRAQSELTNVNSMTPAADEKDAEEGEERHNHNFQQHSPIPKIIDDSNTNINNANNNRSMYLPLVVGQQQPPSSPATTAAATGARDEEEEEGNGFPSVLARGGDMMSFSLNNNDAEAAATGSNAGVDVRRARRALEDVLEAYLDRGRVISRLTHHGQASQAASRRKDDQKAESRITQLEMENQSIESNNKAINQKIKSQSQDNKGLQGKAMAQDLKKRLSRNLSSPSSTSSVRKGRSPLSASSPILRRGGAGSERYNTQMARRHAIQVSELHRQVKNLREEREDTNTKLADTHRKLQLALKEIQKMKARHDVAAAAAAAKSGTAAATQSSLDIDSLAGSSSAHLKDKLQNTREENMELREENARLRERPTLNDFQKAQRMIFKLQQKLNEEGQIKKAARLYKDTRELVRIDKLNHRLGLEVIESIPRPNLVLYLQEICRELQIPSPDHIVPTVQKMSKVMQAIPGMESFIRLVCQSVVGSNDSNGMGGRKRRNNQGDAKDYNDHSRKGAQPARAEAANMRPKEEGVRKVLPTLRKWKEELQKLDSYRGFENAVLAVLEERVNETQNRFQTIKESAGEESYFLVIQDEISEHADMFRKNRPDVITNKMITHFMDLFEVESIDQVFPIMNQIYLKYSEMENFLRNMREMLSMKPNASLASISEAVETLNSLRQQRRGEKSASLTSASADNDMLRCLQEIILREIPSAKPEESAKILTKIVDRLRAFEQVFPSMHEVIRGLICRLKVSKLEEILPTVDAIIMSREPTE